MRTCVVVPHFDHLEQFRVLLPKLSELGIPLIVVDDASPMKSVEALARSLEAIVPDAILIRHSGNLGKGGAVVTGLRAAWERGYTHAVQIDADGQHDCREVPLLCRAAKVSPGSLICGEPVFTDISPLRYYARYITLYLIWLETLSREIRDALCGLRVYPLKHVLDLLNCSKPPKRMAFDPEILVRAVWAGIPLKFVPIHVQYPTNGRSHFRYVRDNLEIAWMHTRLLFGMLIRIPRLIRPHDRSRKGRAGS
jgi:glycosyltransferase involved in cell wall biosynthesis